MYKNKSEGSAEHRKPRHQQKTNNEHKYEPPPDNDTVSIHANRNRLFQPYQNSPPILPKECLERLFNSERKNGYAVTDLNQLKKARNIKQIVNALLIIDAGLNGIFPNSSICNETIRVLGKCNQIELAYDFVYIATCKKNLANAITHNSMITAAGNSNRIDLAEIAYRNALNARTGDAFTHASMITAAGNCSRVDLAEIAYQNAIDNGAANAITHNSMITAAGNSNRIDLAEIAYRNALNARTAVAVTHASMITAAGNCSRVDLAEMAYQNAMDTGAANAITHNGMIEAMASANREKTAEQLFRNNFSMIKEQLGKLSFNEHTNTLTVDLHGYSPTSATFFIKWLLNEEHPDFQLDIDDPKINVITGQGLHCKAGISNVRNAVIKFLENNSISFDIDKKNPGLLLVHPAIIRLSYSTTRMLR